MLDAGATRPRYYITLVKGSVLMQLRNEVRWRPRKYTVLMKVLVTLLGLRSPLQCFVSRRLCPLVTPCAINRCTGSKTEVEVIASDKF